MFQFERDQADRRRKIKEAREKATKAKVEPLAAYLRDPVGFIKRFIPTYEMTGYSRDIIAALVADDEGRSAAKGPRGLGKTSTSAVVLLWFVVIHETARADWKAVITSASWYQLGFFWAEVHKWAKEMDWEAMGLEPWREDTQLLKQSIHLHHGKATSASPERAELIEGAHAAAVADRVGAVLVVFDESKAIPDTTFDAIEGVFANTDQRRSFGYALAVSTPGIPSGSFYNIIRRAPGTENWRVRNVTLWEAIRAGRINVRWAKRLKILWGGDSPFFRQQVQGIFSPDQESAIIPSSWLEAAADRWRAREHAEWTAPPLLDFGVDVAREGKDKTIVCVGRGADHVERMVELDRHDDYTITATDIQRLVSGYGVSPSRISVDADGMGVGLGDILRGQGYNVYFFRGGPRPEHWRDKSGEMEAFNTRAAAWWNMRELLDPRFNPTLCLPPDDQLLGDLASPRQVHDSQGRIKIEEKAQTKKRLRRSPDKGDACVYRHYREAAIAAAEEFIPDDTYGEGADWSRRPDVAGGGLSGNLNIGVNPRT